MIEHTGSTPVKGCFWFPFPDEPVTQEDSVVAEGMFEYIIFVYLMEEDSCQNNQIHSQMQFIKCVW